MTTIANILTNIENIIIYTLNNKACKINILQAIIHFLDLSHKLEITSDKSNFLLQKFIDSLSDVIYISDVMRYKRKTSC